MRRHDQRDVPWTGRRILAVVVVQAIGMTVAFFAYWVAYWALPPTGLSGTNSGGTRALGAVAAVVGALALPAGCWQVWRQRGHPLPAAVGIAVVVVVLGIAVAWAGQLG